MDGWKRMLWTVLATFVVGFIGQLGLDALDIWSIETETWQKAVSAGVAGVLLLILNAAVPWIKQYGWTGQPKE